MRYYIDEDYLRKIITTDVMANLRPHSKVTLGFERGVFDDFSCRTLSKESMLRLVKIASDYGVHGEIIDKENGFYEIQFYY